MKHDTSLDIDDRTHSGSSASLGLSLVITDNDRTRSATLAAMRDLTGALRALGPIDVQRMLDIGCGFGGLTRVVGECVDARECHGIDIDRRALEEAAAKGVVTSRINVGAEPLPYMDSTFDLVVSFGMMDYLPSFDALIREIDRVLTPRGRVLISLPNLGSWHNRLALLLGYQPRDVEVSEAKVVGTISSFRDHPPTGHIHTPTLRAFVELMEFHGFETMGVTPGSPITRPTHLLLRLTDRMLARRVSLARRFFYIGRKSS